MPLTDARIRAARPRDKPYKIYDGGGLFLLVTPNGGRWWRFAYRFNGRANNLSLGVHPAVSLRRARNKRNTALKELAQGVDPGEARRAARRAGDYALLQSLLR